MLAFLEKICYLSLSLSKRLTICLTIWCMNRKDYKIQRMRWIFSSQLGILQSQELLSCSFSIHLSCEIRRPVLDSRSCSSLESLFVIRASVDFDGSNVVVGIGREFSHLFRFFPSSASRHLNFHGRGRGGTEVETDDLYKLICNLSIPSRRSGWFLEVAKGNSAAGR